MKTAKLTLTMMMTALALSACASTGSTVRSGVGDTFMREPPWYAGDYVEAGAIGHVSIVFQRDEFGMKSGPGSPLYTLITEMNAYVDSLGYSKRLNDAVQLGTPPDIQFGCERSGGTEECEPDHDFRHRLAVARPSRTWIDSIRGAATRNDVGRVVVITLETGNYFPDQKNLRGSKIVRLGTDYAVDVPWLTALDKPVHVLQLTGALMDTSGMAIRAGAEGIIAKRTNIVLSGLGVQSLLSDEDIEKVRTARRTDLPGGPLVWQVAVKNLVSQLTGRRD